MLNETKEKRTVRWMVCGFGISTITLPPMAISFEFCGLKRQTTLTDVDDIFFTLWQLIFFFALPVSCY